MRLGGAKAARAVTENIEMELFSSEEPCAEQEERGLHRHKKVQAHRRLQHPLVPDCEQEPEPEVPTRPGRRAEPKPEPPASVEAEHRVPPPGFTEDIEIEMEVFPPLSQLVEVKSDGPSITATPNNVQRLRWKTAAPRRTGLVVKDVVCLSRGQYLAHLDRKERAAAGLTARITVDVGWSANQMASRLAALFGGQFVEGRSFSFTFLQCVQGSRALFVPDPPEEGWTGAQVIRISGHGPLYIFSHQDVPQVRPQAGGQRSAPEAPVANRREDGDEDGQRRTPEDVGSCQTHQMDGEDMSPPVELASGAQSGPELDDVLRLFRRETVGRGVEAEVRVTRGDVLDGALRAARRPGFSFRTTPVVSFSGEDSDGCEGPLREFFRLTLLELQQSCVFQGRPGRLLFTCDLAALRDRKYYEAGVLIGWSLAQGGPGPRCLHPALYQLMCGREPRLDDFSWTDVVDAEVRIRLQQLQSCGDARPPSPALSDWASSCGTPAICSARPEDAPSIYVRLVRQYIYHRVSSMISQFTAGLNSCGGLWDTVRSHCDAFLPVMTSARHKPLTLDQFRELFAVHYSHPDCPLRTAEETTARHWDGVLAAVGSGRADFSFEDVLCFVTGADHPPPLGFPGLISLRFYSQDGLPHASTCALELFLPRAVAGPAELSALLGKAMREAQGFTRFQREGRGEDGCTCPASCPASCPAEDTDGWTEETVAGSTS